MPTPTEYRSWFAAAETRLAFMKEQRRLFDEHQAAFKHDLEEQRGVLETTWRELIGYLLPEVEDAHLKSLQKLLSYPSLLPMKDKAERELAKALARRKELSEMDEIVYKDLLLARVDDEKAEIFDACERFRSDIAKWKSCKSATPLRLLGFYRPKPPSGFWPWFGRWKLASYLMAELEKLGFERFSDLNDLRARYQKVMVDSEPVFELERQIAAKRARIEALNAEFLGLKDAPQDALKQLYADLGKAIRTHIETSPAADRYAMAKADHHLTAFLRKVDGISAQLSYLGQLLSSRVEAQEHQLDAQIAKLAGKISKRRGKINRGKTFAIGHDEIASMQNLKADKWNRRHTKITKVRGRVRNFDRWDQGSFGEHFLWWDMMTGGARADDIYDVRVYRERHGLFAEGHDHQLLEDALRGSEGDLAGAAAGALADDMLVEDGDWSLDAS